jgi:hypothetical protein
VADLPHVAPGQQSFPRARVKPSRIEVGRSHPLPNRGIILTNDNSSEEGVMTSPAGRSEPISLSSEPISVAVNEHVAARRLGLSVDTLRRDRRLGHLGIPFIKLGTGKHGVVRYDLADLDRFLETKKRRTLPPEPQPMREQPGEPAVHEQRTVPVHEPELRPVEPWETEPEPPELLRRPTVSRSPWDAFIPVDADDDPPDDPFAAARRAGPRRAPQRLLRRLKLRQPNGRW